MSNSHKIVDSNRREFLQLMGMTAISGALSTNIAKALAIPAHHRLAVTQYFRKSASGVTVGRVPCQFSPWRPFPPAALTARRPW